MRVLLIDDEQFYFKLIRKTLKEAEYELEYAQSGSEGLAKISAFNPDLLIVDLKLPEMDGFQVHTAKYDEGGRHRMALTYSYRSQPRRVPAPFREDNWQSMQR